MDGSERMNIRTMTSVSCSKQNIILRIYVSKQNNILGIYVSKQNDIQGIYVFKQNDIHEIYVPSKTIFKEFMYLRSFDDVILKQI